MTLLAQPSSTFLNTIATALEAALDDLVVGLYTNTPTPSPTTAYADMTQPTFAGYARAAVAIGTRRGNANGDIILPLGMASFQPSGAVSPAQTVNGAFVAQTPLTPVLQEFEALDTPWVVSGPGSALDIIWDLYVKADPDYGGICTTCVN